MSFGGTPFENNWGFCNNRAPTEYFESSFENWN